MTVSGEATASSSPLPPKKSKYDKIRSKTHERLSGFGLEKMADRIEKNKAAIQGKEAPTVEKAATWMANDIVRTIIDKLDTLPTDKARQEFLGEMWYYIGGIMSFVGTTYDELAGLRQKGSISHENSGGPPKWMYVNKNNHDIGALGMTVFSREENGLDATQLLDHLQKVVIDSNSELSDNKTISAYAHNHPEYISHPYGDMHMSTLEKLVDVCKKNDIEFSISPESTYFTGHTLAIKWRRHHKDAAASDEF